MSKTSSTPPEEPSHKPDSRHPERVGWLKLKAIAQFMRKRRSSSDLDPLLYAGASNEKDVDELLPVTALQELTYNRPLEIHHDPVQCLQFTSDGHLAATSLNFTGTVSLHNQSTIRQWEHPANSSHVKEIIWSPSMKRLMMRSERVVEIVTQENENKTSKVGKHPVESAVWLGDEEILYVKHTDSDSKLFRMDWSIEKPHQPGYTLKRIHVAHLALINLVSPICPNESTTTGDSSGMTYVLVVGTLMKSKNERKPGKVLHLQMLVYNVTLNRPECRVPLSKKVKGICVMRNGRAALVSYEGKVPPELWNIEIPRRSGAKDLPFRLTPSHTYHKVIMDLTVPAQFGGQDDCLVLCATKDFKLNILDRKTGVLIHQIEVREEFSTMAWNHTLKNPAVAIGFHNGSVKIWTVPSPNLEPAVASITDNAIATSPGPW